MKLTVLVVLLTGLGLTAYFFLQRGSLIQIEVENYVETEDRQRFHVQEPIRGPFIREKALGEPNWSEVSGTSVVAFNPITSVTYYERNIDEKRAIASITKLMTSLVALDVYELDDVLTVTKKITITDRTLDLQVGDKIVVSELLEATLIASKNDAAELLAQEYKDGYAGFVDLMNEKAVSLGMNNSHFSNTSGYIDNDNYSTASDLRLLTLAAIRSDTIRELAEKSSGVFEYIRSGTIRTVDLRTTNELFGVVGSTAGLKTGYTVKSGQSFVGYFVSSEYDQVVTIILNSSDRFGETKDLLDILQENYSY
jgi:D-alanyl-D-alanine carboxypeptidase